ncbi:MAG TPA: carbamate kinase [Acidimicrobiia bacterium]|nr:carbamate kinase [Acidimicrobiia bacterium]
MDRTSESHQRVVLALGGNAISPADGDGTAEEQIANMAVAARSVVDLVSLGYEPVITHGNGPQVGNLLLKNELSAAVVSAVPLDWCVAQTQASIGFTLVNEIELELGRRSILRTAASVITRVVVDPTDPSFDSPGKPIGRVREDGSRRLVPSPPPIEILDYPVIESLLDLGVIVVACGGGGIPMIRENGNTRGVEAVVDKDLCAALLAERLAVKRMVIVTNIDGVKSDYGGFQERLIREIGVDELRGRLRNGEYPTGSMEPKIRAVLQFIDATGGSAAIGSLEELSAVVRGEAGTQIC